MKNLTTLDETPTKTEVNSGLATVSRSLKLLCTSSFSPLAVTSPQRTTHMPFDLTQSTACYMINHQPESESWHSSTTAGLVFSAHMFAEPHISVRYVSTVATKLNFQIWNDALFSGRHIPKKTLWVSLFWAVFNAIWIFNCLTVCQWSNNCYATGQTCTEASLTLSSISHEKLCQVFCPQCFYFSKGRKEQCNLFFMNLFLM